VLEVFATRPRVILADIARASGLSEATALRYVASLRRRGWVTQDDSGAYSLGVPVFHLGQFAVNSLDIRKLALPHMSGLLDTYQETVNLAICNDRQLFVIEVLESTRTIKTGAGLGDRDVWHASALGKAVLAHLDEAEVHTLLKATGMPGLTATTLTTLALMDENLTRVRERGYALDDGESEIDLRCVAAPIFDRRGLPTFAMSVSGPASRLSLELLGEIGVRLCSATQSISQALGHVAPPPGRAEA